MKATRNGRTAHAGGRLADPVDTLRDDIAALRKDVAAIVTGRVSAMSDAVTDTLHDVRRRGARLAAQSRKAAGAAHQKLGKTAGSYPVATIAVAAVAGIVSAKVLGWMLRR